jgi:hypothetical protein
MPTLGHFEGRYKPENAVFARISDLCNLAGQLTGEPIGQFTRQAPFVIRRLLQYLKNLGRDLRGLIAGVAIWMPGLGGPEMADCGGVGPAWTRI